jgi:hypothetical protein
MSHLLGDALGLILVGVALAVLRVLVITRRVNRGDFE